MNRTIPILPCKDLDTLLDFYRQIGFEVTYRQKAPNPYAIVEYEGIRLDFYAVSHHDPKTSYYTCYVLADEADRLYEQFTTGLRNKKGKLPTRGLPRISEIRDKAYGVREFMFSDPAGNCIRVGRKLDAPEDPTISAETAAAGKRLALVLDYAYRFEDDEGEFEKVPALLDKAIDCDRHLPCDNLFKVMSLRADYAIQLGELGVAERLLLEVRTHPLNAGQTRFHTVLQRVADLEAALREKKNPDK
ncbi:bleomycin resistance protein [Chitinophaga caseinilytica]|uniref:bleomycin resistance protein n=1 Tax=Chitinophaga caseinilytica TaxID=2267521 RepID=UPI003C2CC94D